MIKEKALEMLKFEKVEYTPTKEIGYVNSVNDSVIFVKFGHQTDLLGWEGTTSQACNHEDVKDLNDQYHGWITDPGNKQQYPKNFAEGMGGILPTKETEARMGYVADRFAINKKRRLI